MGIPHLPFDFGTRHQRGNRVDHQDIDGTASDEHIRNLKRLLAGIRLGDEQLVAVDPELTGIPCIECMLCIDKSGNPSLSLGLGHRMQRKGRFSG